MKAKLKFNRWLHLIFLYIILILIYIIYLYIIPLIKGERLELYFDFLSLFLYASVMMIYLFLPTCKTIRFYLYTKIIFTENEFYLYTCGLYNKKEIHEPLNEIHITEKPKGIIISTKNDNIYFKDIKNIDEFLNIFHEQQEKIKAQQVDVNGQ